MRYQRQITLKEWGAGAQEKLARSRVLVIGAGGLGCPALQYLCAAGVGTLGIVDGDRVSLPDLHRQILFGEGDIGAEKATTAASRLAHLSPSSKCIPYPMRLHPGNALDIVDSYDVILDASDNFPTRYLLSDACALLNKPLVYGSVSRFEGQVGVYLPGGPQYRDIFPNAGEVPSCAEAGVLGVVAGIIGNLQALEVLKIISGVGQPLAGRLLTYQALTNQFYEVEITPPAETRVLTREAFQGGPYTEVIDPETFNGMLRDPEILVLDIRETGEEPQVPFPHVRRPLSLLRGEPVPYTGRRIAVFCRSGQRSLEAAALLGTENTVYALEGGILGWLAFQNQPDVR
jgi:molybdopterin/thiamine biosynthesis adenylyltransferase/rhodanese-related sulfurtransferase